MEFNIPNDPRTDMLMEAMNEERDKLPHPEHHSENESGAKVLLYSLTIAYAALFGFFAGTIIGG